MMPAASVYSKKEETVWDSDDCESLSLADDLDDCEERRVVIVNENGSSFELSYSAGMRSCDTEWDDNTSVSSFTIHLEFDKCSKISLLGVDTLPEDDDIISLEDDEIISLEDDEEVTHYSSSSSDDDYSRHSLFTEVEADDDEDLRRDSLSTEISITKRGKCYNSQRRNRTRTRTDDFTRSLVWERISGLET